MTTPRPSSRVRLQISFCVVALLFSTTARAGLGVWTTSGPLQGGLFVVADQRTPGVLYAYASRATISVEHRAAVQEHRRWCDVERGRQPELSGRISGSTRDRAILDGLFLRQLLRGRTRTELFVSTDGGASCTALALEAERWSVNYSLAVDAVNQRELFVSVRGNAQTTLSRSLDAGATWTRIDSDLALGTTYGTKVVTDPSLSGTVYVVTGPNLFKSVDSGAAWVSLAKATSPIAALAVDPTNSSVVYMGGDQDLLESAAGAVVKSRDGGVTFRRQRGPARCYGQGFVYQSPQPGSGLRCHRGGRFCDFGWRRELAGDEFRLDQS